VRRPAGERLNVAGNGKIPTDGGEGLRQNPFAALSSTGDEKRETGKRPETGNRKPETKEKNSDNATAEGSESLRFPISGVRDSKSSVFEIRNRGRVDVRRETGNRGGKTVTVVTGFVGIGLPEKEQLAKKMRAACGCGGTVKDGQIEIQGDQREPVARILTEAGFRPVFAGG
jgi:translation initiation factor 1